MLSLLSALVSDVMTYVLHPRVLFTHMIVYGLLYDIYTMHGRRVTSQLALAAEVVTLLLWLLIPNSWATIIVIALAIYVYEHVIGPKIEIIDGAIFYTG